MARGAIPTRVGARFGGGVFAGLIRRRASVYVLVVAPRSAEVAAEAFFAPRGIRGVNFSRVVNGAVNSRRLASVDRCIVGRVGECSEGGFSDWYTPSRVEMEVLYTHFRPVAPLRKHGRGTPGGFDPVASSAVIPPMEWLDSSLVHQTVVTGFQQGFREGFATHTFYWSSTGSAGRIEPDVYGLEFGQGVCYLYQTRVPGGRVRPVRCVRVSLRGI